MSHAYFPDVLAQLGVPGEMIEIWEKGIRDDGFVLIPQIHIKDDTGEQRLIDGAVIEEKSLQLKRLASRLAKYLSPQIYDSIFSGKHQAGAASARKNLTIFFSDIEKFTDLSDKLEPERLAAIVNSYLSEMSAIAIGCGGTIDKFIGDAVMVFFGDPETSGAEADALKAVEMALRMQTRIAELQDHWKMIGAPHGLMVWMGITTGYCTVGNFGSDQRLDYTVFGSPVNLAARLQGMAPADSILISEETQNLVSNDVECDFFGEQTPKGFPRPVRIFQAKDFHSEDHRKKRVRLSRKGDHVEVNVIDSSNIRVAIAELKRIQEEFERQYPQ